MTLPTIDLKTASDQQINAAVGEHCTKMKPRKQMVAMNAEGTGMAVWEDELTRRDDVIDFCKRHPEYTAIERDQWPDFLHNAAAVIELLEKHTTWACTNNLLGTTGYTCYIQTPPQEWDRISAKANTFARAACIALLKASGKCQVKE